MNTISENTTTKSRLSLFIYLGLSLGVVAGMLLLLGYIFSAK